MGGDLVPACARGAVPRRPCWHPRLWCAASPVGTPDGVRHPAVANATGARRPAAPVALPGGPPRGAEGRGDHEL